MKKIPVEDYQAWKNYIRYRRIATLLLFFMGLLTFFGYFLFAFHLFKESFWLSLILTGSQAGFIGGCADWFAVTALFRHPMGLPIPHTAILPQQQKRLGHGLGWFVAHYVFTEKDITMILDKIDLPAILSRYLFNAENVEAISAVILKAVPKLLDQCEDGKTNQILTKIVYRLLSGESVAPLVGRVLRIMIDNVQHHDVISFVLEILKKTLKEQEYHLREMIQNRVREQGGRFVGWMIGDSIATKVLVAINQEMDRIDPHNEEVRFKIGQWFKDEIDTIENNPAWMEKISETLKNFVSHEAVQEWRESLWKKLRILIEEDAKNKQGWLKNLIIDFINYFSNHIQSDERIRQTLDRGLLVILLKALPQLQTWLIQFTESVVSKWDSQALVNRLECRVGKDLQYIRINGSIVGFLIGIILYLILHFCFHGQTVRIL